MSVRTSSCGHWRKKSGDDSSCDKRAEHNLHDSMSDVMRSIQHLLSDEAIHKINVMKITKNIGMLLLAAYLIIDGLL